MCAYMTGKIKKHHHEPLKAKKAAEEKRRKQEEHEMLAGAGQLEQVCVLSIPLHPPILSVEFKPHDLRVASPSTFPPLASIKTHILVHLMRAGPGNACRFST
jgi:hypothetical protein